jgi:hypothetical protein
MATGALLVAGSDGDVRLVQAAARYADVKVTVASGEAAAAAKEAAAGAATGSAAVLTTPDGDITGLAAALK